MVLHDAVLHHFLLGRLTKPPTSKSSCYNYGEWTRGLAARVVARARQLGHRPALFRVSDAANAWPETSRAVVVHNPAAAAMVRRHAPDTRVVEIPHLFEEPPLPVSAAVLRWRAGAWAFRAGAFLFGVFGYLRESKRLFSVLDAFASCARRRARLADGGGAVRLERPRARYGALLAAAPELCASPICPRRSSGPRPRRWMPVSICAIRRRGKPPASRSG